MIGTKILEERKSKFNGTIRVVKTWGLGTYIQVEGITQSGGIVVGIWRSTLGKIRDTRYEIQNVLILGLGGGTVAKLIRKQWPGAKITGVEVDPAMVELGKKYLGLDDVDAEIVVADARKFLKKPDRSLISIPDRYDVILVDLYKGRSVPKQFEIDSFLSSARRRLAESGCIVFNRLYYGEKRPEAMKFAEKLEKIFPKVEYFYPEANLMLLCYK